MNHQDSKAPSEENLRIAEGILKKSEIVRECPICRKLKSHTGYWVWDFLESLGIKHTCGLCLMFALLLLSGCAAATPVPTPRTSAKPVPPPPPLPPALSQQISTPQMTPRPVTASEMAFPAVFKFAAWFPAGQTNCTAFFDVSHDLTNWTRLVSFPCPNGAYVTNSIPCDGTVGYVRAGVETQCQ